MKPNREVDHLLVMIQKFHREHPDIRVGQLISNALYADDTMMGLGRLFWMENDDLAAYIEKHGADLEAGKPIEGEP